MPKLNINGHAMQLPLTCEVGLDTKRIHLVSQAGNLKLTLPRDIFPIEPGEQVIVTFGFVKVALEPDNLELPPASGLILPRAN